MVTHKQELTMEQHSPASHSRAQYAQSHAQLPAPQYTYHSDHVSRTPGAHSPRTPQKTPPSTPRSFHQSPVPLSPLPRITSPQFPQAHDAGAVDGASQTQYLGPWQHIQRPEYESGWHQQQVRSTFEKYRQSSVCRYTTRHHTP